MKSILTSIKPKWVAKILNGEKTIEIRKKFPKDYVGWVYIYCTKGNKNECLIADLQPDKVYHPLTEKLYRGVYSIVEERAIWNDCKKYILNGKVVARFWCDKVEYYEDVCAWSEENEKASCVTPSEFFDYMHHIKCHRSCHLIHIAKLEIFDKPKELSRFKPLCENCKYTCRSTCIKSLKAPQSWCYIENI